MANLKLEDVVAQCLSDMEQGGSLEDCLVRYPEHRESLTPLLRTAVRLRAAPHVLPTPAFKQAARLRLTNLVRARTQARESGRVVTKWSLLRCIEQVRLKVIPRMKVSPVVWAASVLIFFLLVGAGSVRVSTNSLPGDVLYPVKLAAERTQLLLSPDEESAAELRLSFAEERLEEAVRSAQSGRWEAVREATARYAGEMDAASTPLEAATNGEELRELLTASTAQHLAMIHTVHEMAPSEIEPFTESAVSATWRSSERAGFPPPSTPTSRDLDGDGISNAEDDCPYAPGGASFQGCPSPPEDQDSSDDDVPGNADDGSEAPGSDGSPTPVAPTELPRPTRAPRTPTPEPKFSRPTKTPESLDLPVEPTETPESSPPVEPTPSRPTETPESSGPPVEPRPPKPTETPRSSDLPVVTSTSRATEAPNLQ